MAPVLWNSNNGIIAGAILAGPALLATYFLVIPESSNSDSPDAIITVRIKRGPASAVLLATAFIQGLAEGELMAYLTPAILSEGHSSNTVALGFTALFSGIVISQIGLGVNDHLIVEQVLRHADLDALMLAGRYTLLDQAALPTLMPLLQKKNIALALGGVFNSGILATRVEADRPMTFNYAPASQPWVDKALGIQTVCDQHGVLLPAAALQFALAHPAVQIVMLGVRNPDQWRAARQAERDVIPAAFWQQLRHEGWLCAEAPVPGEAA